jgi:hypothetical protein
MNMNGTGELLFLLSLIVGPILDCRSSMCIVQ